jgi:hypothetical protein
MLDRIRIRRRQLRQVTPSGFCANSGSQVALRVRLVEPHRMVAPAKAGQ